MKPALVNALGMSAMAPAYNVRPLASTMTSSAMLKSCDEG